MKRTTGPKAPQAEGFAAHAAGVTDLETLLKFVKAVSVGEDQNRAWNSLERSLARPSLDHSLRPQSGRACNPDFWVRPGVQRASSNDH